MRTFSRYFLIGLILWIVTVTPWGYDMGSRIFNNSLHNWVYCSVYDLLAKHPTTEPSLTHFSSYLNKCLVKDPTEENKIKKFLEKNQKELERKVKKIQFNLKKQIKD